MQIRQCDIPEVKLIQPVRHGDARGFFSEIYREDILQRHGIALDFVQENHSYSAAVGTIRGLHFQTPPFDQAKLVRVARGAILDVAVDIRRGSPTYGQHVAVRLSAEEGNQLLVPVGFAHGFCTLEPDTELVYKVTSYYAPNNDCGLAWDDPALDIAWPVSGSPLLSDKDRRHPRLSELPAYFEYGPGPEYGSGPS